MNNIFNMFNGSFGMFGSRKNNTYNPLINYDWSTTTTSGLRYLKDVGSTPTYNASMYFGRGAYFNGVDQTITVPINTTIQTALKRVNGVVTINETSQTLTNYVISGLGVHKDYYLFTRLLTTAEKDSYTNTPEAFYAMAQADSTCVLNMPMCETDRYARNMKSYSLGNELSKDVGFDNSSLWRIGDGAETLSSMVNGILHFKGSTAGSVNILNADATTIAGEYYEYEVVISEYTSGGVAFGLNNYYINSPLVIKAVGTYKFILQESVSFTGSVRLKRTEFPYDMKISSLSVKKLSGTYPITNYTSSVRDNAKNLQYGLQTCKFVRDSLGVVQSASDYLECNGTGYAIIPSHADTVNIKMTVNPTSLSGNLLSGGVTKTLTGLALNIDNEVVVNNVTPTGAITLASGFSGTIKSYKEELV